MDFPIGSNSESEDYCMWSKLDEISSYGNDMELEDLNGVLEDLYMNVRLGEATEEEVFLLVYGSYQLYAAYTRLLAGSGYYREADDFMHITLRWFDYYMNGRAGLQNALDEILKRMLRSDEASTEEIHNVLALKSSLDVDSDNKSGTWAVSSAG